MAQTLEMNLRPRYSSNPIFIKSEQLYSTAVVVDGAHANQLSGFKPRCETLWTVDVDRSLEKDGPDEPVGPEKRETLIGRGG